MKKTSIFTAILLMVLSCYAPLSAQEIFTLSPVPPVEAFRELPRTQTISYASEAEARAGSHEASAYLQPLTGWTHSPGPDGSTKYSANFHVPFSWVERHYYLYVSGITAPVQVHINGQFAGYSNTALPAAEFEIGRFTEEGLNRIEITVSGENRELFRNGSPLEGIETYINAQPRIRIRDYVSEVTFADRDATLQLGVIVKSNLLNHKTVRVHYSITDQEGTRIADGYRDAQFEMRSEDTVRFLVHIPDAVKWNHDLPYLYDLNLRLQHEGRYTEYIHFPLGLRNVSVSDGKLSVNSHEVPLIVETAQYTGEAETLSRLHELRRQGVTAVSVLRPQPGVFYVMCDRVGLYVIDKIDTDDLNRISSAATGYSAANDPQWENLYRDRILTAYHHSRNNPSVIAYSLGDGPNGYNMYEGYLTIKRREVQRPVIFLNAGGQWNTDAVSTETARQRPQAVGERLVFTPGQRGSTVIRAVPSISVTDSGTGTVELHNPSQAVARGYLNFTVKQGNRTISAGRIQADVPPAGSYTVRLPLAGANPSKNLKYQFDWH